MHLLQALLFISLVVPGSASLPTRNDSIRTTIRTTISIAQTTLVHIQKLRTKLPDTRQINTMDPSIDGLTSITYDLGLLDNELQSSEVLAQIQADVSSLEGMVRSLAVTKDCTIRAKPGPQVGDNLFPDTQVYLTLTKVERYLEKLLLNKDKLKVC